jgi:cell shape-determining protein MreC
MLSLFILLFSGFALIRFAVSQWRAIWISSANQPLSESLQLTVGIDAATIGAEDFGHLMNLCDQLSPELKKSSPWLSEVSTYYRAITRLRQLCNSKLPSIANWASREMETCARYVAVVLDQNLAMNLDRRLATQTN